MILSHDFYDQVSQIIPVLFLTGLIEMAAVARRWEEKHMPTRIVLYILFVMTIIVLGEVSALWVASEDRENGLVRTLALYGVGAAGFFAMLPLVDTVLDWAAEPKERSKWLDRVGGMVAGSPMTAAIIASLVIAFSD